MSDDVKTRKRMIVEEVEAPATEIKEKVEELQTITEGISESVEKSTEVQEDLAKAAEEITPAEATTKKPKDEPNEEFKPTVPVVKNNDGPNPLVIIIPGIFLLGALLGGIIFYQHGISGGTPKSATPSTYDNLTASPSPSPDVTPDLTKYPINVMNGSGISGQAGVVKNLLTTAGFTVSATGNASSYDFTKTVIKAKVDVPTAFLTQLSTALSKSYVLDTNQSLATSSADVVQVIVGSTKAQ
jgi:hypothetical protein